MRAELKSLTSLSADLPSYRPDEESFCIEVIAAIGTAGTEGADNFSFKVCSPAWLIDRLEKGERVVSGRRLLFMNGYSYEAFEAFVRRRVEMVQGPDWESIVAQLSLWSNWEFAK